MALTKVDMSPSSQSKPKNSDKKKKIEKANMHTTVAVVIVYGHDTMSSSWHGQVGCVKLSLKRLETCGTQISHY